MHMYIHESFKSLVFLSTLLLYFVDGKEAGTTALEGVEDTMMNLGASPRGGILPSGW